MVRLEAASFMGVHHPAAARGCNNPLGIHLPASLGLNSAQWGKCFAPSREENLHFFMGLSITTRTSGRINYLNMQIKYLNMQIDWICSCLLGVNTGSDGDIFSKVTCGFPIPFHKDSRCIPPCLVDLLGWPQHTKGSLGLRSPKWSTISSLGLAVIPDPALQVSNLSQDVTSASAERQQGPVGLILQPLLALGNTKKNLRGWGKKE